MSAHTHDPIGQLCDKKTSFFGLTTKDKVSDFERKEKLQLSERKSQGKSTQHTSNWI
jgi:hypothetical protein